MADINENDMREKDEQYNVGRRNDEDYKVKESKRMDLIIAIFAVMFAIFMWMYAVSNPGTSRSETKPAEETTEAQSSK